MGLRIGHDGSASVGLVCVSHSWNSAVGAAAPDEYINTSYAKVKSSQRQKAPWAKTCKVSESFCSKLTVTFTYILLAKSSHLVKPNTNEVSIQLQYRPGEGSKYL